jgi:hypothetical protein
MNRVRPYKECCPYKLNRFLGLPPVPRQAALGSAGRAAAAGGPGHSVRRRRWREGAEAKVTAATAAAQVAAGVRAAPAARRRVSRRCSRPGSREAERGVVTWPPVPSQSSSWAVHDEERMGNAQRQ